MEKPRKNEALSKPSVIEILARVLRYEWQQRKMTCILDSAAQTTLLERCDARDATWEDLTLIIRKTTKKLRIEIVDQTRLLERICSLLRLIPLLTERRIDRIRVWCCWHCHDAFS